MVGSQTMVPETIGPSEAVTAVYRTKYYVGTTKPADLHLSTRKSAIPELVVGAVSGKSYLSSNEEGKDPLIVPVEKRTGAVLVKTIRGIKQAWGVAINSKDQLIVVEGNEGVVEEVAACKGNGAKKDGPRAHESEVNGKDKDRHRGGEKSNEIKNDNNQGGGQVLILSLQGDKINSFGQKGDNDGEFDMPRGVAVDDDDNIYVVDKMNSRIQKFTPNGEHLASIGKEGHGALEFDWPKAISIHPQTKNVYVTEANNHRVQILKPDLTFLRKIGAVDKEGKPRKGTGVGEFNIPLGVAFDKAGRVYITDAVNDRIQVFTEDDKFIAEFGDKGKGDGQLRFPSVVCIDKNDILYVTEVDNHRVSVFKIDSSRTTSRHPVSHPKASRSASQPVLPSEASYLPPSFLTTFTKESVESFYYGGIAVDKQGVVYVTDSCHDELQMFLI